LLNTFGSSNLNKRLNMLHTERSPRATRRKLLFALPTLALAILLVSWQPTGASTPSSSKAITFTGPGQLPEFPGGQDALIKFMSTNLKYPETARKDRVEGQVFVVFTVRASGQVTDATVKRGVRADLDAEALRVVNAMPNWKPAVTDGKPSDAQMTLPISFKLGSDK
jgi:TonB family protein